MREANSLNPDQTRHSVGPDLAPNCLQRLSEDSSLFFSARTKLLKQEKRMHTKESQISEAVSPGIICLLPSTDCVLISMMD